MKRLLSCIPAILSVIIMLGCSEKGGLTYQAPRVLERSGSGSQLVDQSFPGTGEVPSGVVLSQLQLSGVVKDHPPLASGSPALPLGSGLSVRSVLSLLEVQQGWVFDEPTKSFIRAVATHSVDGPDAFGRAQPGSDRASLAARGTVCVSFRFRDVSASLGATDVTGGVTLEEFSGSVPEGVRADWENTTERSYFEGVQSPASANANVVVDTQRQTVSSGLQFEALVARLPGGLFRMDGKLSVSAFVGTGLDRTVVSLPAQVDGPRGQWVRLLRLRGVDGNLDVFWNHLKIPRRALGSIGGTAVDLEVRVD